MNDDTNSSIEWEVHEKNTDMKKKINNPELVDKIENGFKSFIASFGSIKKI